MAAEIRKRRMEDLRESLPHNFILNYLPLLVVAKNIKKKRKKNYSQNDGRPQANMSSGHKNLVWCKTLSYWNKLIKGSYGQKIPFSSQGTRLKYHLCKKKKKRSNSLLRDYLRICICHWFKPWSCKHIHVQSKYLWVLLPLSKQEDYCKRTKEWHSSRWVEKVYWVLCIP